MRSELRKLRLEATAHTLVALGRELRRQGFDRVDAGIIVALALDQVYQPTKDLDDPKVNAQTKAQVGQWVVQMRETRPC